jgi:hypothetical protein
MSILKIKTFAFKCGSVKFTAYLVLFAGAPPMAALFIDEFSILLSEVAALRSVPDLATGSKSRVFF